MEYKQEFNRLIKENQPLFDALQKAGGLEQARDAAMTYVLDHESRTLHTMDYAHPMERSVARRCIQTLKNIFSKRSEDLSAYSALEALWRMAAGETPEVTPAFLADVRHLLTGMRGETGQYHMTEGPAEDSMSSREISRNRSNVLDGIARQALERERSYVSGLEESIIQKRKARKERIMAYFGATEEQWQDWTWQCRNVIRNVETAEAVIQLTDDEKEAIRIARAHHVPFGITPYYAMLMDEETDRHLDHAVRAQVLPPLRYSNFLANLKTDREDELDFMGEHDTSPEELITRRYPMISIFKPYNTCSQICVYCQRNWEIEDVLAQDAQAPTNKLQQAIDWYREHPEVTEVLVTGGDPAIMSDQVFKKLLDQLCALDHIKRIRVGTRIPVVMPMRITDDFADLLEQYHVPGKREVCVMTHFEHSYEITPESMEAVQKLRKRRISVYNQGVFTMENARRFEMVALRKDLRRIGVDPYYTFNTKGKEETLDYRLPIARLIQEQTEEARLNPGVERTDEAVFNIPRLGKNYLRAGQDHEVIMILPGGERVYEFYPWDLSTEDTSPYIHVDLAIQEFLDKIRDRGENPEDYSSIWYYV